MYIIINCTVSFIEFYFSPHCNLALRSFRPKAKFLSFYPFHLHRGILLSCPELHCVKCFSVKNHSLSMNPLLPAAPPRTAKCISSSYFPSFPSLYHLMTEFFRLAPPLHIAEDELAWLLPLEASTEAAPSPVAGLHRPAWDPSMCQGTSVGSEVRRLMTKAFKVIEFAVKIKFT